MFFLLIYWDCNSVFLLAAVAEPTGPKKNAPSLRTVGRSENPGLPISFAGMVCPLGCEIGLTDLPKTEVAMIPPAPPGTTGLSLPATRRGGLIKEIYFQFQAPAQAKSNSLLASFTLDAHFPF